MKSILIVDDEEVIRNGIRRTIQKQFPKHRIHLAGSPEEAVDALRHHHMDIVLTDILMPGMTGLEFMAILRRHYPHIKAVVISAHSEFAYAQEAVRLGAKDYLLKPIGKDRLIELIANIGEEIDRENKRTLETQLMKSNLNYLREAVFQRLASGLDLGRFDITSFIERYPSFHLVMVRMDSDKKLTLEHFMIENVLSELIEMHGDGFVVSIDNLSLLSLVKLRAGVELEELVGELRTHLKSYLKRVPFKVLSSELLHDLRAIPNELQRMRQASVSKEYEHYDSGGDTAIEVALQYMKMHYHEELSLEKTASVVFLNPVYFSQLFKQKTGQGFKEYVIHLRMEQAKQLLQNAQLKLADIAERIGYQDVRHFTQIFRKKFELTPTEYRQRLVEMKSE
ncbi:response regulator [Paenibacillus koleovorans]|uniref:response regulator n=1 Tax=Paenibacillus koleovorans TaxID=121608 RepID=UPI000FD8965C|nr:response regulator [Paenibacillus koleovorans]